MREGCGAIMNEDIVDLNERENRRILVRCSVEYDIGGINLKGITANASSDGIMVKSFLALETVFEIFRFLDKEPNYQTILEFSLEGETYLTEAEIKHFHLDSFGDRKYLFRVGFGFLKGRIRVRRNGKD